MSEFFLLLICMIVLVILIGVLFYYGIFPVKNSPKNEKAGCLNSIYDDAPVGLYRTTTEGKILFANHTLCKILGYTTLEELQNHDFGDKNLAVQIEYDREMFRKKIEENGMVHNFKSLWRKTNGDIIYLNESAKAVSDKNGKIIYYDGIIEDITQRKNDEEELSRYIEELQLNKDLVEQNAKEYAELTERLSESEEQLQEINRSKDKFFSIISHDLRSPFNALIGFSDLLVKDFEILQPDETKNIAQNLNQSIKNIYKLIENLLQWSGLQTGKMKHHPKVLNLHSIVLQILDLLIGNAVKKDITIVNQVDESLYIYADEVMVNSIIQNIVANAIKFTRPGGLVKISSILEEEFIKVTISDTGVGIDENHLDKLFRIDSDLSTKGTSGENGTGLGLILCKELVEKNGGKIKAESICGHGTSFIFTLPYVKGPEIIHQEIFF